MSHFKRPLAFGVAIFVATLFGFVGSLQGQTGNAFNLSGQDLQVAVSAQWVGCRSGGYIPIQIRLKNRGPAANIQFELNPGRTFAQPMPRVTQSVRVEQNAVINTTLLYPCVDGSYQLYAEFSVIKDGKRHKDLTSPVTFENQNWGESRISLLVISDGAVDVSKFESTIEHLMTTASSTSYYAGTDSRVVETGQLPDTWLAYTGIDLVAITLDTFRSMDAGAREEVVKYVRTGGNLMVFEAGTDEEKHRELDRLLKIDGAASSRAWVTPRLLAGKTYRTEMHDPYGMYGMAVPKMAAAPVQATKVETEEEKKNKEQQKASEAEKMEMKAARLMAGKVFRLADSPFPGDQGEWTVLLNKIDHKNLTFAQRTGVNPRLGSFEFVKFLIPGVKVIPTGAFILFITLFTVLIGPVNYLFFRLKNKIHLLLVSIPAIAIVSSLALFAFSAVATGWGTKARLRSVTLLDQKNQIAVSNTRMALFTGSPPAEGLSFDPATAVYPIWPDDENFQRGNVDWTLSQNLGGGWLQPRTRTQFLMQSHRTERERLNVKPNGDTLAVSNGFNWDIQYLLITGPDGNAFYGENLVAGSEVQLRQASNKQRDDLSKLIRDHELAPPKGVTSASSGNSFGRSRYYYGYGPQFSVSYRANNFERILNHTQRTVVGKLPVNTYIAIVDEPPNLDLPIESFRDSDSLHVIIGSYE